ncbi:MAG: hypothetical protein Q9187_006966 [Circinaria calcarea]
MDEDNGSSHVQGAVTTNEPAGSIGDVVVNIDNNPAARSDVSLSSQEAPTAEPVNQEDQSGTQYISGQEDDEASSESEIWKEYRQIYNSYVFPLGRQPYMPSRDPKVSVWRSSTFSYHHKLEKKRFLHPEVNVVGDFFFRARFVLKSMLHIIKIPHDGEAVSEEYDCKKEDHVHRLRESLNTIDQSYPLAVQLVIVSDLSPVILELLGRELRVDRQVFVNHLWTHAGQPFDIPNSHVYDLNACLDPPPNTVTVECDVNMTGWSESTVSRWFLEDFFRKINRDSLNTLRSGTIRWPASLDVACFYEREFVPPKEFNYGNPFLRIPGQDIFQPGPAYSDISRMFCESRSKSSSFYQTSLIWVSGKVVDAFNRLLQQEMRRLAYFKEQRMLHTSKHVEKTAESSDNPVWDLRILRNKTYDKLKTIQHLRSKLRASLDFAEGEKRSKQSCDDTLVLGNFDALEKRIHDFLDILKREMDDTTVDGQQELTNSQLEESRKSIEQNDQVRKLTILAFFFVPISTVSSVFGMNVKELQLSEYQPHIWVFAVVVCCVIGASLLLATFGYLRDVLMGVTVYVDEQLRKGRKRPQWFRPFIFSRRIIFLLVLPLRLLLSRMNFLSDMGRKPRREKKENRRSRWFYLDTYHLKPHERSPKKVFRWLLGSEPRQEGELQKI